MPGFTLKSYQAQITDIDHQISIIEKEPLQPIKELRTVYLAILSTKMQYFKSFRINNSDISLDQAATEEYFNSLKSTDNIYYYRYAPSPYSNPPFRADPVPSGLSLAAIENQVSQEYSYSQRELHLLNKASAKIEKLKQEKNLLKVSHRLTPSCE